MIKYILKKPLTQAEVDKLVKACILDESCEIQEDTESVEVDKLYEAHELDELDELSELEALVIILKEHYENETHNKKERIEAEVNFASLQNLLSML